MKTDQSITDFLNARIAEDEAVARAAIADGEGAKDWAGMDSDTDAHIARHDPARVLAECAAKRAIVEAFDPECPDLDPFVGVSVIGMLAAVYADHPAYLDGWRVGA